MMTDNLSTFVESLSLLSASPNDATLFSTVLSLGLRLLPRCPAATAPAVLALCHRRVQEETEEELKRRNSKSNQETEEEDADRDELSPFRDMEQVWEGLMKDKDKDKKKVWAVTLAQWAAKSLGDISAKYAAKISKLSGHSSSNNSSLHSLLPLWTSLPSCQVLVSLLSRCLSLLAEDKARSERCVSALLDTSVRHAPHFDWVVAHVGGMFPDTVVQRMLAVGLKDFCGHAQHQSKKKKSFSLSGVPKINSVVGILGHLAAASSHDAHIRDALHALVSDSVTKHSSQLENDDGDEVDPLDPQVAAIPFLLHLASRSDLLAAALIDGAKASLTPELAETVADLSDAWEDKYFGQEDELLTLVVKLIVNSESKDLLVVLLDYGTDDRESGVDVSREVRNGCRIILDCVLGELMNHVHDTERYRYNPIPVLKSAFVHRHFFMTNYLLTGDSFQKRSVLSLLSYLSLHEGRATAVEVIKFCLQNADTPEQLGVMMEFIRDTEPWIPEIVGLAVEQCLRGKAKNEEEEKRVLDNLGRLLHYQKATPTEQQKVRVLSQFATTVEENLNVLVPKLGKKTLMRSVLKILSFVPLSLDNLSVELMHSSARKLVHAVFVILEDGGKFFSQEEKNQSLALILDHLIPIASHPAGLGMVQRFFLDGALSPAFAQLFGGVFEPKRPSEKKPPPHVNLMEENFKFGSMPTQPLGTSTVFHAGTIGDGKRAVKKPSLLSAREIDVNTHALVALLFKTCHSGGRERSKEACKQLALLLVETISPDVMYNGLPWPEEEFIRVTMERDLKIAKQFERNPVLWKILWGLAESRPALCYCSVLLRALLAVQMNFWQSSVASKASSFPRELSVTCRVLQLMSVGQYLPPPLSRVADVLDVFHAFHVHCVLVDIWNYMRDNVPSPVAFASNKDETLNREFEDPKTYRSYCERLRLVMLRHVEEKPGEMKAFFVEPAIREEKSMLLAMEY